MRTIILSILVIFISGCGSYNFEPTPAPNEIVTIVYTTESQSGTKTWKLVNDNLKVTMTTRSKAGRIVSSKSVRSNFNRFSLIITNLEKANFTKLRSVDANYLTQEAETMVIETHAKKYTYTQNSSSRFPKAVQETVTNIVTTFK